MTIEEKVAAFDVLFAALVNRWSDGTYSGCGYGLWEQPNRATAEECLPDLLAWAERVAKYRAKQRANP